MDTDEYSLSKMKDFLMIYNKMAERCFNHCIDDFNTRDLTSAEVKCIENCSSKGLGVSQKLMMTYIEVQPEIVNKRAEEIQKQQNAIEIDLKKIAEGVQSQQSTIESDIKNTSNS